MLRKSSYSHNPATKQTRLRRPYRTATRSQHGRPRGRRPRVTARRYSRVH